MNNFVQKEFGIDALPPDKIANMYGFCNQHYQRNVLKVAKISKYVDPSKKDELINLAKRLPEITEYSVFDKSVLSLTRAFPNTIPWICWYLHEKTRRIHFQALKDLDTLGNPLKRLLKTTHGQEGLGGFLKASGLEGHRGKFIGDALLEHVCGWMQTFEDKLAVSKEGMNVSYKR